MPFAGVLLIVGISMSLAACNTLSEIQDTLKQWQSTAQARGGPPTQADKDAAALREGCRDELRRICSQQSPSAGPITQCIANNRSKMSEQCRALYQVRPAAS
jgi:hypothetical protein